MVIPVSGRSSRPELRVLLLFFQKCSNSLDVLAVGCRYDHVGCSLHVKKCGIELHARPWHWGWRPVFGDHFLNK